MENDAGVVHWRQQGLLAGLTVKICGKGPCQSFTQEVLWELYWRQGVNLLGAFQTNLVFRRFQSLVKHE